MRQSKDIKLIKSCFAPVADNCDSGDVNDALMKGSACLHIVYVDAVACLHIHYVDGVAFLHIVQVFSIL